MKSYVGRRIVSGCISVFFLITITFFLVHCMPGSPFAGGNVAANVQEAMEVEYGLHEPIIKQYGNYLCHLLQGDLGISLKKPGETVSGVIAERLPYTLSLGVLSILTAWLVGVGVGITAFLSKKRWTIPVFLLLTVAGVSIPNFALSMLLIYGFGVKLQWLPVVGLGSGWHYILPVLALSTYPAAVIARMVYRTCKEEYEKHYVDLAIAKGMKKTQILKSHMFPHMLIPVVNYLGPASAFLLTGSFAIESIFTIPGLGREFVAAISNRDYTMIMGLTVFMGVIVIGMNLATDLFCAWLDPRIRRNLMKGASR